MPTATCRTRPSACSRSSRTRVSQSTTCGSITISEWRPQPDRQPMSFSDLLLQQTINGLSLGAMYSLLALGFTLVYGILELINFAHFNVFMVGSFIGMWTLQLMGINGQAVV